MHDPEQDDLVTVFRAGDPGLVSVVHSLLEGEGIDYIARNDNLQDLFGWGRIGSGFSILVGPVEFQVRRADLERAEAVLRELDAS